MSLIRISTILLVFISTQVICDGPDYCKDLITNGSFSPLQIFRLYGKNQKEWIRLYNKNLEFGVELTSDKSLKFKERIVRVKGDDNLHKYGAYIGTQGLMNCEVPAGKPYVTFCRTTSSQNVMKYDFKVRRPLFVIPYKYSEHVLIVDQNDRNRYFAVYPQSLVFKDPVEDRYLPGYPPGKQVLCDGSYNDSYINETLCRKPTFLQQLDDDYFSKLDGVLDTTVDTKFAYLLLFLIEGRHKYCYTFEEKLSKECNSSVNMKTLFTECFEVNDESKDQSIDPLLWVFIVLVIITVILMIAIVWMDCRRKKEKKSSGGTDWTTVGGNTLSNESSKTTSTSGSQSDATNGSSIGSKTKEPMPSKSNDKKTSLQKPKK